MAKGNRIEELVQQEFRLWGVFGLNGNGLGKLGGGK